MMRSHVSVTEFERADEINLTVLLLNHKQKPIIKTNIFVLFLL